VGAEGLFLKNFKGFRSFRVLESLHLFARASTTFFVERNSDFQIGSGKGSFGSYIVHVMIFLIFFIDAAKLTFFLFALPVFVVLHFRYLSRLDFTEGFSFSKMIRTISKKNFSSPRGNCSKEQQK